MWMLERPSFFHYLQWSFALLLLTSSSAGALSPGSDLKPGVFPAVGKLVAAPPYVGACTATLITHDLVLTAAHCVCEPDQVGYCASRATFEFTEPYNIQIPGTVLAHPEFGVRRWFNEDLAVIRLDYPSSQKVGIAPIIVAPPYQIPSPGTPLQIVGFGRTGEDCQGPAKKKWLSVNLTEVSPARIMIDEPGKRACPGDSGAPILSQSGQVVGVVSWIGEEINGRPTYANYNFIFGLPGPAHVGE